MFKTQKTTNGYALIFTGDNTNIDLYLHYIGMIKYKTYNQEMKKWIVPDLLEIENIGMLKLMHQSSVGDTLKLKPYPYQKEAIEFCLEKEKALLVLPCGAGKTILGIGTYVEAKDQGLITGPGIIVVKASLKTQWQKEVEKFSYLTSNVLQTKVVLCSKELSKLKTKENKLKKLNPIKDKQEYQSIEEEIKDINTNIDTKFDEQFNYDLLILNYEAVANEDIKEKLHKIKPQYVFSDEIHYVKNHKAVRSKALHEFGDAKMTIGATATPIQRDYQDAFGIFKFIKSTLWQSFSKFAAMHIKYSGPGRISGFRNIDMLREKIAPYTFIKTKEEISSQLPSLVVMQRYCSLDPCIIEKTQEIFFELEGLRDQEKAIRAKCKTEADVFNNPELMQVEAQIMALQTFAQELADEPSLLEKSDSDYAKNYIVKKCNNNKLDALYNLVEEIIESGEKVCIFSRFRAMQPFIAEHLKAIDKNMKFAVVNGSVKDTARYEEVYTKFRDTPDYKILLCTDSLAEGANLSSCKYLVEYDLANSYAIQTQRHGRIERADSIHDNVFVYQIIANESYDEVAFKIVSKKEGYDYELIKRIRENS